MLPGDSRSNWNPSVLDDPRVTQFWDGDRIAGRWLADHHTGDLEQPGGVVWDAFLGFGASARWQTEPSQLLAAGSTIIANTDSLERAFVPALASA
jgi:hypothetical protein